MSSREMIVGATREHIVGAQGHRDYDELMEMGAEPHPVHAEHRPAPQHPQAPHHGYGHGPDHGQGHGHPRALPPPHALAHPRHGETVIVPRPGDGYGPGPYDGGGSDFPYDPRGAFGPHPHHQQHHPHHGQHGGHHPHHGGPHHGGHHPHHGFEEHEEHERHHQHHPGERRMRIVKEEPKNQRQFPIGFSLDDINPGDEVDIEVKPQVLFRGERLAIAQSIARYFEILDIKVGKDSQLAATGALTGEAFETRAVGVRMELDTAQPGIVITIRVRNIDTAAQSFKAVLYGAVLE